MIIANCKFQISNWQKGFTLVELIVVFAIIATLSMAGVAAFVDYSRAQAVQNASLDFATVLQTAKSRAQSQVRQTQGVCVGASPLDGYRVIVVSNQTYRIESVFGGNACSQPLETKTLAPNVTFQTAGNAFLFRVLSGLVDGASATGTRVVVVGYGKSKGVTVYQDGRIEVN